MNEFNLNRQGAKETGYVLLFAIILLAIFLTAAASLVGYTTLNVRGARVAYQENQALYLAEAGIEKAINQLNQDGSYTGETSTVLGAGEFTVQVTSIDSGTKKLVATGYIPDSASPQAVKTVHANVSIDTTNVAFNFGVQVGAGGLVMDNNSKIFGNVFSNGNITGGKASTTGDVVVAAGTSLIPDEQWTVQNDEFQFGHIAARKDVAQSFRSNSTNKLNKVQVYVKKIGTPGDLTVRVVTNNDPDPSKTVITSATIASSLITSTYGWVEAAFSTPPDISSGVTYWLMLSAPSISAGNYYFWGGDSNNGYGNGVGKYSNKWDAGSPLWDNVGGDLNYKLFMGGVVTYFDGEIKVGGNLQATEIRECGKVTGVATYDTVFTDCTAGTSVGGIASPGPETMPISQAKIDEWKQVAEDGGTIAGPYAITGVVTLGPIKIDGDMTLVGGSTLYLTGPIWVKGNIILENNTFVYVHSSLGNSGTVLLADNPDNPGSSGIIDISNNAIIGGNGNPNSFAMVLTASSNLTGAMSIRNNSSGAIYYSSNGSIEVNNNAGGSQITAYKLHLNNLASVTYSLGLQNSNFSNGPGGSWKFQRGSFSIEP